MLFQITAEYILSNNLNLSDQFNTYNTTCCEENKGENREN